ncbi:retinol dehydrogenase 12 [Didymella exigua CBS 183.55]|uniref:Retinol dehydrogenase 12 n=1 Tax=Didymella exigua CBS 183.55 TaxID=1150837 RepID=A0A6A5RCB2_9PLEO|nr:retinol dehydrogenase 12 [Didymella exigua CBS 183.55]KAF1923397.1 retinol dehydrogenase 12 [Didymella exigua CBS 183.55]
MGFVTTILHSQFFVQPPVPSSSFSGQTVVVTGATSGLGYEAAKHILRLGASRLILAVRNVTKGKQAAEGISSALSLPPSSVDVWELDLGNFSSVKQFGERINTLDRLDAVVQNAGIMTTKFTLVEGCESQIAVNVISPVLLGYLVISKLQQSAAKTGSPGRLAFVGSDLQFIAPLKEKSTPKSLLAALNSEETADMSSRYGVSKLLLMWAVRDMAQRYPFSDQSDVLITCLTPGLCQSSIVRDEESWIVSILRRFAIGIIARSTEVGSRTLVHGVKPELGDECHGAFLMDCKVCKDLTGNTKTPEMEEAKSKFLDELSARLRGICPGII